MKWAQASIEKLEEIFKSCGHQVYVTYPTSPSSATDDSKKSYCFKTSHGGKLRKVKAGLWYRMVDQTDPRDENPSVALVSVSEELIADGKAHRDVRRNLKKPSTSS